MGRITTSALELFGRQGYEATTLEAVAAEAGISPRTFFHYFKSKEDIVLAWQDGLPGQLRSAILAETGAGTPLEVLKQALLKLLDGYDATSADVIIQLIRSSDRLQVANHAKLMNLEDAAAQALESRWPDMERRSGLRIAATVAVGALRIALDRRASAPEAGSVSVLFEELFKALEIEVLSSAA
ncbi:TetR/AcrR family transcriptional regulator [Brevundimonas sp. FT23042]|uniref:TetR/AcrR family transcriptional regulator n=1 Tax=Brevundimonas sp. FT23042 TaxID=3393749 RepID=UPI003B58A603